ncbi:MAG: replicative DNA helicase [Sphaerochaetaceae bacterium]
MAISNQVPPQNIDAERAVIGAMLQSKQAFEDINGLLTKDDFYKTAHSVLYQSILDFKQDNPGQEIDIITIVDYLRNHDTLDICGGMAYIAGLTSNVPTTTNARYYAKIVKDYSIRRQMLDISSRIKDSAYDESSVLTNALDDFERQFSDISNLSGIKSYVPAKTLIMQSVQSLEERRKTGVIDGIQSGYKGLDQIIGGFKNSEFIIIAARPSVGKTAFALSIAGNIAIRQQKRVGFFSLEMSGSSLADRMLSAESNVSFSYIRNGKIPTNDADRVFKSAEKLYEMDTMWIQDTPNMKLYDLRSQARKMVHENGVQIIFIDYIGLIDPDMKGDVPRFEQVGMVSRSLKQLARELEIPVVVLCQVGREGEKMEPTLANLRDSGSIEQDADLVIILHKERRYENIGSSPDDPADPSASSQDRPDVKKIKIIIAKQRNGEVGYLSMGLRSRTVHFENWEEEI